MGSYNSVFFTCLCGNEIEWQSKAGDCISSYTVGVDRICVKVADNIDDEIQHCSVCNRKYSIKREPIDFSHVSMKVVLL